MSEKPRRTPLQILVLPSRVTASGGLEFAIFRRSNYPDACWQGIAGGAEQGKTTEQAARREMLEEAAIPPETPLIPLDSAASIPASCFRDRRLWGPTTYVVPQRAFGVRLDTHELRLSEEHTEYRWASYADAVGMRRWDSKRTAPWELRERLRDLAEASPGPPDRRAR
jgi:dATP pyrophosphohydrolase